MNNILHIFIIMIVLSCPINSYSNKNHFINDQTTYTYQADINQTKTLDYAIESENIFDPTAPIFTVKTIVKTINAKKLQLILGLALMMFISLIRGLNQNLSKDYLPWLAMITSITLSGLLGLYFHWPRDKIFIDALSISTCANGLWSLLGKHVLNVDY